MSNEVELLLCLIPFVPGIYGVIRTRVWRKPRFWVYTFLFPLLSLAYGIGLSTPVLRFWGGTAIAMGILAGVEIIRLILGEIVRILISPLEREEKETAFAEGKAVLLWIFPPEEKKKTAFTRFAFFLLCLPLLNYFLDRYGGYFIDL